MRFSCQAQAPLKVGNQIHAQGTREENTRRYTLYTFLFILVAISHELGCSVDYLEGIQLKI